MTEELLEKNEIGGALHRLIVDEHETYVCPRCHESQLKRLPHWCPHDNGAGLN